MPLTCQQERQLAVGLGQSQGRIATFLLSALRPLTQDRYMEALLELVKEEGVAVLQLPEDDLDVILSEKVLDLYEVSQSSEGIARANILISAVSRVLPRLRFRTAWKNVEVWRARHPPFKLLPSPLC